ncbi:MAG TPA: glutaredoxin family protein [Methanoculleus sp.]|nr:glutaredoxin family protein [Methanoculleus sp.]
MTVEHVDGDDRGDVLLYALSTCQWCRKTKELLIELGVAFDYIYVDLLEGSELETVFEEVKTYNPRVSFPTLVINGRSIAGFQEEAIREALGN